MLGNRVNDLEARLATQGKLLAEREFENNQLKQANEAAERTIKELRDEIAALSERRQFAGDRKTAQREGRGRGTASRRPRRARQAAARHQRDPAAGRKLLGHRAHGKRAAARAHQRHRRRGGKARDAARRPEFGDRGHAGRGTGRAESAGQTRQRRHRRPPPQAPRKAAARSPNASARCSPTPPAPASRGRNLAASIACPIDRLTPRGPHFVNRGL